MSFKAIFNTLKGGECEIMEMVNITIDTEKFST
jgi:hypothetical protein